MPNPTAKALEAASAAFLGGLTFSSLDLHNLAIIANAVAVIVSAYAARRAALGKPKRKRKASPTNENV